MQQERIQLNNLSGTNLYKHYAPSIFAYLYRQTGSREEAEDLLVEVFLAVLEHRHFSTFSDKEQQLWLWTVARNKARDYYRRFSRHPSVPLTQEFVEAIYDEDLTPEQALLRKEEYANLHIALKELSPSQQELLQLRFGHGLNCVEIADVLNKTEAAVRMLLWRTLKRLRRTYKKS